MIYYFYFEIPKSIILQKIKYFLSLRAEISNDLYNGSEFLQKDGKIYQMHFR